MSLIFGIYLVLTGLTDLDKFVLLIG